LNSNNSDLQRLKAKVCALLQLHAIDEHAHDVLSPWIAAQSLLEHHLYEDLGLPSRTQMGHFMQAHFPTLSAQKPKDKLWKKFLYDAIDEVAPACATCDDQATCFRCLISQSA